MLAIMFDVYVRLTYLIDVKLPTLSVSFSLITLNNEYILHILILSLYQHVEIVPHNFANI